MRESKFQFLNPHLVEVYFTLNSDFNLDREETEFEMNNSFSIHVKRNANANQANVELALDTNMEDKKAPFMLQIKVASDFKWEDLEESVVDSMLHLNAPALLLGYMRPIVAGITNSSGFPAYNLPFINFKE